jgi:hypothetical protein
MVEPGQVHLGQHGGGLGPHGQHEGDHRGAAGLGQRRHSNHDCQVHGNVGSHTNTSVGLRLIDTVCYTYAQQIFHQ